MYKFLFLVIPLLYLMQSCCALIAFSCTEEHANYTSISLVDVPECHNMLNKIETKDVTIQLVQKKVFREIKYYQCSIIARNHMFRCGRTIDTPSPQGMFTDVLNINLDECLGLIKRNSFYYKGRTYSIGRSEKEYVSATTHGSINSKSSCNEGDPIVKNGIEYDRPVIQTEFEITKLTRRATVDLDEDKIIFEDGTKSRYSNFETYSADKGFLFWVEPTNLTKCNNDEEFTVLYQGPATKVRDTNYLDNSTFTSYIIQMPDYDLQIGSANKKVYLCGLPSWTTEHPKLNIIEKPKNQDFILKKEKLYVKEINLLTYINSKLVYLMRHTGDQINSLYQKFAKERCETENRITRNLLTLAILSPVDFAYEYTQGPGSTALVRGEVVYLVKCQPVEVTLNPTDLLNCYEEFPVTYNNRSMYMNPRSRLLTSIGTKVDCLQEAPIKYKIDGIWHALYGSDLKPHSDTGSPHIISSKVDRWQFKPIRGFIGSGIYKPEELDKLEKFLMNPIEKEVIQDTLSRKLNGHSNEESNVVNLRNLFPENLEEHIIERISNKFSAWYKWQSEAGGTFGFILLCFFTIKMIKGIINSLINFKILYETFGLGWKLLSFAWSNCTHVLLKKEQDRKNQSFYEHQRNKINSNQGEKIRFDSKDLELLELP